MGLVITSTVSSIFEFTEWEEGMQWLQKIDGNKTYIMAVVGGVFAIVHFLIVGDYTMGSFFQLGNDTAFCGMVAALRHGIAKSGNQGVLTQGGK